MQRLNSGQIVDGRYRIARLLAQGGMGSVYRAWDLSLNIPVALKEMLPDPTLNLEMIAEYRNQFRQEAQVLANLHHPNLPRVTHFFAWNNNDYLIMDFVEGESLADRIRQRGALPDYQVIAWAEQLLDALEACHQNGIVHRDIKPQNIIIRQDERAVLVDFGLVKLWDPAKPKTQRIIRGMGTPEYASPEHLNLNNQHTQPRSDIYSLGATLYHAVTGSPPPSCMDRMIQGIALTPPRAMGRDVRPDMERVILRAMSIDMRQRFASAPEMKQALQGEARRDRMHSGSRPLYEGQGQGYQHPTPIPVNSEELRPATRVRSHSWMLEIATGIGMAILGTLALNAVLFGGDFPPEQYLGLSIGSILLGSIGWFVGDTIFQALTMPGGSATYQTAPGVGGTAKMSGKSPTQRLVMTTRKLIRRLTPAQQIGMLVTLVVLAGLLALVLGPVIADIPFLWNYLPSYAFAAPLAYAAVGKRSWRAGIAHLLVAIFGGLALRVSAGTTYTLGELLFAGLLGSLLIEALGFFANHTYLQ